MALDFETSWTDAENEVFAALCKALGSTPNRDAFLGAIPMRGIDSWALTTGGGIDTDSELRRGENPEFISCRVQAALFGVFVERAAAQRWAMKVCKWLKTTDNFRTAKHVQQFEVLDMPGNPELFTPDSGDPSFEVWSVSIPCEMGFRTEAE